MQTTKLVLVMIIGLAMIEFSLAQSLNAATSAKAPKPSHTSTKHHLSTPVKPTNPMQGVAAVYSDKLHGRKTASGQRFCQTELTAAHRSLPLGTKVRVTNLHTSQSVEVVINDRGPRRRSRLIDLSAAAAEKVGMRKTGSALVKLEIVTESSVSKS